MSKDNNIGNSPIKTMFAELAQLDDMLSDPSGAMDNTKYMEMFERHWFLREQIAVALVQSLDDLSWLAYSARLEAKRDPEFTNDGPGSARALAQALANGALKLAGAPQ